MVDLLLLAVLALPAAPAAASAVSGLDCPRLAAGSIKVDGFFVDWQGSEGLQGIAPGSDLRWELRAARDAAQLYLVFGAHDDSFVPTPPAARPEIAPPGGRPWTGDHLELRFVATDGDLPASGQTAAIVVLPGDLEDRPPRAAFLPAGKVGRGGGQATSLVVDGATRPGGGWLLELALPFALLP
ncbi:MAG: hypothetical protein FJ125_11705, partial [Deltaproteobacteria bacterium]|nr:hypothetical protein [Deltaproteobacteria bacterium]